MRNTLLALLLALPISIATAQEKPQGMPSMIRLEGRAFQLVYSDWFTKWNSDPMRDNERLYCVTQEERRDDVLFITAVVEMSVNGTPNSVAGVQACKAATGRGEFIHTHPTVGCPRDKRGDVIRKKCARQPTAWGDEEGGCEESKPDDEVLRYFNLRYMLVQCAPNRFRIVVNLDYRFEPLMPPLPR